MNSQKTLWIINQYASTPQTGIGGRHFYMASELSKVGHRVYVISAAYSHLLRHPHQIKEIFTFENVGGFKHIWVKGLNYGQAHAKLRVINWFLFAWRLRKLQNMIADKPDAILCSSPSLVSFLGARWLARRLGCRLIFEVRDIWPLTLIQLGGFSPGHPVILFLGWVEKVAYRTSDRVISNLPNAVEHMQGLGMSPEKFTWVGNGIALEELENLTPLNKEQEKLWPRGKFIVGYAGTHGSANALEFFVDAAIQLKEHVDIAFVLVGDGRVKEALQNKVKGAGAANVHFLTSVAKHQVQAVLARCDVCYLGWYNNPLYRFGISPNKMAEYLYAAKPIIHSFSGNGDLVLKAKAGITVPAEDPIAIVRAILDLKQMPQEQRREMGLRGRRYVIENLQYRDLAKKIAEIVFN